MEKFNNFWGKYDNSINTQIKYDIRAEKNINSYKSALKSQYPNNGLFLLVGSLFKLIGIMFLFVITLIFRKQVLKENKKWQ